MEYVAVIGLTVAAFAAGYALGRHYSQPTILPVMMVPGETMEEDFISLN